MIAMDSGGSDGVGQQHKTAVLMLKSPCCLSSSSVFVCVEE